MVNWQTEHFLDNNAHIKKITEEKGKKQFL